MPQQSQSPGPKIRWNPPEPVRVTISEVRDVASEQFGGAFAGESDGNVSSAHFSQKPDRQCTRVGAGIIAIVDRLLDGVFQMQTPVQVEFDVIRAVTFRDRGNIAALIEAAPLKRDRESSQAHGRKFRSIVNDG